MNILLVYEDMRDFVVIDTFLPAFRIIFKRNQYKRDSSTSSATTASDGGPANATAEPEPPAGATDAPDATAATTAEYATGSSNAAPSTRW